MMKKKAIFLFLSFAASYIVLPLQIQAPSRRIYLDGEQIGSFTICKLIPVHQPDTAENASIDIRVNIWEMGLYFHLKIQEAIIPPGLDVREFDDLEPFLRQATLPKRVSLVMFEEIRTVIRAKKKELRPLMFTEFKQTLPMTLDRFRDTVMLMAEICKKLNNTIEKNRQDAVDHFLAYLDLIKRTTALRDSLTRISVRKPVHNGEKWVIGFGPRESINLAIDDRNPAQTGLADEGEENDVFEFLSDISI